MASILEELSQAMCETVEQAGRSVVRLEGGRRSSTSGVVLAPGRVVTSSKATPLDELDVVFETGAVRGKVIGRELGLDLAVLAAEVPAPPLVAASAAPRVGQWAVRLGRPGETVRATAGIVSAASPKSWTTARGVEVHGFVDADASLLPGFLGGPLLALGGGALGLATLAGGRGAVTLPWTAVVKAVEALGQAAPAKRSTLGARLLPVALPDAVKAQTGEALGLMVMELVPGGPAERAGLCFGDTVLHLGDDTVKTLEDFVRYLDADRSGQTVPATVLRGGKVEALRVVFG